jgi:Helix-turn-helix domain
MNRGIKPQIDLSQIPIFIPVMSREQFAALWGRDEKTVYEYLWKGDLPAYRLGRRLLVNIVKLAHDHLMSANYNQAILNHQFYMDLPVMPYRVFAQRVGVSDGVVRGWINRGYVPSELVGKDRLVNVAQLVVLCSK